MAPIGLPASSISPTSRSTSGLTRQSAPSAAKVHRFLAAPRPPGKMRASIASALTAARSLISPRAIRAASTRMLRCSPCIGERVRWLTTAPWLTLGAQQWISAPAWSRASRVRTDSCISAPSKTPQPERQTATRAMMNVSLEQ